MSNKINDKDVELYLLKNTDFFLTRESIVSELSFKHSPGKAESLLERQVRKLRSEQKDFWIAFPFSYRMLLKMKTCFQNQKL